MCSLMRDVLLVYILLWGLHWQGAYLQQMLDDRFIKRISVILYSFVTPSIFTFIIFKMFAK